jgi:hypothetical protein
MTQKPFLYIYKHPHMKSRANTVQTFLPDFGYRNLTGKFLFQNLPQHTPPCSRNPWKKKHFLHTSLLNNQITKAVTSQGFFTFNSRGRYRAASPKKNSEKSCSFPQKLNLHQIFSSPSANIQCNFSPKLRAGLLPQPLKKKALSHLFFF